MLSLNSWLNNFTKGDRCYKLLWEWSKEQKVFLYFYFVICFNKYKLNIVGYSLWECSKKQFVCGQEKPGQILKSESG